MVTVRPARLLSVCACVAVCILIIGAGTASASHYRYQTISWERDLTYVSSTDYKVHVTFHGGWRWSFTYQGYNLNSCPTSNFTATGATGIGSCPPIGQSVTILNNIAVTKNGAAVNVRLNSPTATPVSSFAYTPKVTEISQSLDLMYADYAFDLYIPIASNPVTITHEANARISTLLEGNNDQQWKFSSTIDVTKGTKSPKSVSLPVIYVTAGIQNTITLPTVAFDNYTNKFRFSTTAESDLVRQVPGTSTASTLDDMQLSDTGVITWTPTANVVGPYAAQFTITSYDTSVSPPVPTNSIPLDLIFQAQLPQANAPSVSLTTPQTSVTFNVGTAGSYQVTSTISPAAALYSPVINHSPLPPVPAVGQSGAAAFSVPAGNTGATALVGTTTWTPSLSSLSDIVCYQAGYRRNSDSVVFLSPGQLCVNMTLGALATTLTISGPTSGSVGDLPQFTATLIRTADGAPVASRQILFTVTAPDGSQSTPVTATTDSSGHATATVQLGKAGTNTVSATFNAVVNELLQSSAASANITAKANSLLGTIALANPPVPSFGFQTTVNVPLLAQPSGNPAPPGNVVGVTVTDPNGGVTTQNVATNASGIAALSFNTPVIGNYTVVATFAGNNDMFAATNTPKNATLSIPTIYQRVQLAFDPATFFAVTTTTTRVRLTQIPSGTPLANRLVSFSLSGGVTGSGSANTDSSGYATFNVTPSTATAFTLTASVALLATEANHAGVLAAESTAMATNSSLVVTALSAPNAPASSPLNTAMTVSSTLTRTTAPAGSLSSKTVLFSLITPNTTINRSSNTDANGIATVTFTAAEMNTAGVYTVLSAFTDNVAYANATSSAVAVAVTTGTPTTLTTSPINAVTGQPVTTTVHLATTTGATPVANAPITLAIFGGGATLGSGTTNASGDATISWTAGAAFNGQYIATFAGMGGSTTYAASSSTNTYIVVAQTPTTTTVTCPTTPQTSPTYSGAPLTPCTATVTGSGGFSQSLTVTYTNNVHAGTNTATASASFAGDSTHFSSSDSKTFSINTKAASVTPNVAGKAYGDVDPPLSGTLSGFVAADNVTATYSRTAGNTVGGSPYTISATLNPTGVLTDYAIQYNTAAFTITTRPASVTPNASGKTYGGNEPALTGTLSGFLAADNVIATYTRTAGESVLGGPYTISAGLSPAGVLGNYQITYNTAAFIIGPLSASVSPAAASKIFGDDDPSPLTTGTLSGFLAADNVAATYSRTTGETPGPYPITANLTTSGSLNNYSITVNPANFTINAYAFSVCDANGNCTGGSKPNSNGIGGRLTITPSVQFGGSATVTVSLSPATLKTKDALTSPGVDGNNQPLPPTFTVWLAPVGDPTHPTMFGSGIATKSAPDANGNSTWSTTFTATLDDIAVTPGDYIAYVYGGNGNVLTNGAVQNNAGYGAADTTDYTFPTLTANLTVNRATTTVSISAPPVTYGSDGTVTVAVSSTAGIPSGNVSLTVANGSPMTAALNNGSAVFTISHPNAGDYALNASYAANGNFAAGSATGSLHVDAKAASVSPAAASKTYGDSDPSLGGTLNGFLAGDNVTATYSRTAGETVLGGPYTISATLSPAGVLTNYNITYNTASFTINTKAASVSPAAASKTYGDADPTLTGTLTGFLAADNVTATYSRTAGETVLGGPYTISATLSPAGVLTNYNITHNTASFTINTKAASVSPAATSKTYGDADPSLTGTLAGFLAADNVTATYSRTAGETVLGGPYTISATLSPAGVLTNYNITYNTASFTINTKAASVSPAAASKTYGDADPTLTGTLTGFLAADNVTATYSRTAGETVLGGPYTISAALSPAGVLTNYNITYNTASFTVNTKAASVSPAAASKTYGDADPSLTGTLAGFLAADNVTATYSRTAGNTVLGGPYTISATLSPAAVLSNYNITYNTASFTITTKTASVTPAANSKTYGGSDPALSGTLAGFFAADNVTATYSRTAGETVTGGPYTISATLSPAAVLSNYNITYNTASFTITTKTASVTPAANSKTYGGSDPALSGTLAGFFAADNVTATYSRTAGETVTGGPYTISATLSPAAVLSNYNITYNTASFTITAKTASVTPAANSKIYGGTEPTLTGALSGFVAADSVAATYSRAAGETVTGGPYTISATLSPAGVLSNYNITYNTAQFTITAKAATVSPAAANKTYGDPDPTFTGTLSGFLAADNVTATYSRNVGDTVNGGPYTISATLSPANVLTNYNITYNTAGFSIGQAGTAVTINCTLPVTYTGGAQTPCTAQVSGANLTQSLPVSYANNINAGTGSATASASYGGDVNHTGSSNSVNFGIDKAGSSVSFSCTLPVTYTGSPITPCTALVTGAGNLSQSLTVSYVNNTHAGTNTATANASYAGDSNHNSSSNSTTFSIAKANPIITWAAPAAINQGTALSGTQLNATASVAGSFVYTPPSGTVLPVGTQPLSVAFTPTNTVDYNPASATVSITVNATGAFNLGPGQTVTLTGGSLSGNVTMGAGSTLILNNSTTGGNVTVDNGATITLNNSTVGGNLQVQTGGTVNLQAGSTVQGNLQMQNGGTLNTNGGTVDHNIQISGASTFSLVGTSVGGNLQIQNIPAGSSQNQICGVTTDNDMQIQSNGVAIAVGSSGPSCAGNHIGGNLQVTGNTASVSIYNNTVAGDLQVNNNTAPESVFTNIITKNLQCNGNTSTITGGGNTAKSKSGQCSLF